MIDIIILALAILFVAAGLFGIAMLVLWPFVVEPPEQHDGIERFEVDKERTRWFK